MYAFRLLSIAAVLAVGEVNAEKRVKRLLFGTPFSVSAHDYNIEDTRKNVPYTALYYTVVMKPAWSFAVFTMNWDDNQRSWDASMSKKKDTPGIQRLGGYRNVRCGGSFLTPRIVQTACHCIAYLTTASPSNDPKGFSRMMVVWEEPMIIYPMVDVDSVQRPPWGRGVFSSQKYYAHHDCHLWSSVLTRFISHDFGLIRLGKGDWGSAQAPAQFPSWDNHRYRLAPLYTVQDLNVHYRNIVRRQSICLFLGLGLNTYDPFSGLLSDKVSTGWALPQYSWRAITGSKYCFEYSQSILKLVRDTTQQKGDPPKLFPGPRWANEVAPGHRSGPSFYYDYLFNATWTCSIIIGKYRGVPTAGDGGFPVSCNNVYFAVQGSGWTRSTLMDYMAVQSAIAFAKYQNAAEYRNSLIKSLDLWGSVKHHRKLFGHAHENAARRMGFVGVNASIRERSSLIIFLFVAFSQASFY